MMKACNIISLLLLFCAEAIAAPKSFDFFSPDHNVLCRMFIANNRLCYTVEFFSKAIVDTSQMDLVVNGQSIAANSTIGNIESAEVRQDYPYRGNHSVAKNHYVYSKISIQGSIPFAIELRMYNDGVAFRYVIQQKGKSIIDKDLTSFSIPSGVIVWSQPNIKY